MAVHDWIAHGSAVRSEPEQGVSSAAFHLSEIAAKGIIPPEEFKKFQKKHKLADLYWRAYWRRGDIIQAGGRENLPRKVDGVVVFMHGWDGSGEIFENLPARVCGLPQGLLVLVPDVNGFYRSPFSAPEQLDFEECSPAAAMAAVENWLSLIGILGGRRHTPLVFVGHSMSGAALFYLNERRWSQHPIGRLSLAPALLMNDLLRKGFYATLGISIWAGDRLNLNKLSNTVSPKVVGRLIAGASKSVQAEHERVFKQTAKQTTATAFYAMGRAALPKHGRNWARFKVLLGHEDRLVGVSPMLNLLAELGFSSRQVRVVLGDHYFFSVGQASKARHTEAREIALEEIAAMVSEVCK